MSKTSIGFIGLGLMGYAMVQRLQSLGYPLHVMANRSRTNVEAAVANGAVEHATPKAVAEASDIIMLMVCSAVVTALPVGVFMTAMPRFEAALTSMLSTLSSCPSPILQTDGGPSNHDWAWGRCS